MSSSSSDKKKIKLKSSDGDVFEVEAAVAMEAITIKTMINDDCVSLDGVIPMPNVTSKILALVIEYCKKHQGRREDGYIGGEDELEDWDAQFAKVDQSTLFDLILAANSLNIKGLVDLTCKTVADMMKGKTPDEIRQIFHIVNDYTPEEEEEVRKEHSWAFE